jgi:type IV secretory pathway TrbL component
LIAGEALCGLITAWFAWREIQTWEIFAAPSYVVGLVVLGLLALLLIRIPLGAAGRADEPAPPTAMM